MFEKIEGINKVIRLGLPTPKTVFVKDLETQNNEVNNFLLGKESVMVRSEHPTKSTHCPRILKASPYEAKEFIKKLNSDGYTAILQEHVPLNNEYSGNILVLNNSFIIEAIRGGPVSKLNRDGLLHEHLRISKNGELITHHGESVIPMKEITKIINKVSDESLKNNIIEFSKGPDWFYFWHARADPTSKKLEI